MRCGYSSGSTAVDRGKAIEKHAAWRDPLIGYYDGIQTKRREARERKHIQKIEQKMLEAKGMDKAAAREQAEAVAEVLVQQAGELKAANDNATMMASESVGEVSKPVRVNVKSMLKAVDKPAKKLPKPPRKPVESAVKLLLSAKLRFLLAAALLAGGFLWAKQNINVEVAMIGAFNAKLKKVAKAELPAEPAKK